MLDPKYATDADGIERHGDGVLQYGANCSSPHNRPHVSAVNDPFVNISAICPFVPQNLIETPGSVRILSNNQSRSTLCVRVTCLNDGLRPFIIILITASLPSSAYSFPFPEDIGRHGGT